MAISAIMKQVNTGEDPRNLMQISNDKIQNKQLQGKKTLGTCIPLASLVCFEVSKDFIQKFL